MDIPLFQEWIIECTLALYKNSAADPILGFIKVDR